MKHFPENEGWVAQEEQQQQVWVSVAVGVASVGLGAASAAGAFTPSQPNLTADSQQMAITQAELLPEIQAMQAQAELGGQAPVSPQNQAKIDSINKQIAELQNSPTQWNFTNQQINQQIAKLQGELAKYQPANFSGYSSADVQGQIAKQLAAGQLATDKQYDPQFIAANLAEEKLANPQGVAARDSLYKDIQSQIANPPTSPVANEMQRQVSERVNAGSGLTPEEQAMLNASVNNTITGTSGNNADFANQLTTGQAGEQRALTNTASGTQFLASGETPDDISFRANQQDIANLAEFYGGQTPQAEFKSLTGAQTGATPLAQSPALPQYNTNAAEQGAQAGVTGYEQQVAASNPWLSGISSVLTGVGSTLKAIPTS